MVNLNKLQEMIIAQRKAKGFPSATDLDKTSLGLLEEAGEFEKARRQGDHWKMVNALVDIMIFCLGGLAILDIDPEIQLVKIVEENAKREHEPH